MLLSECGKLAKDTRARVNDKGLSQFIYTEKHTFSYCREEFTTQIQLLNSSCHMQEIEQSGTVNYFTFNKKIQEYPKQEQAWHTSLSAHPTLFHGNFCGKTRLQYQENNNFTKYVSNQFNLMSSLSADFQEGARLHFTVCRKNACLRRGTHATDARLAKSRS